jgi:peptide/nickel transport system substrate-binding protein
MASESGTREILGRTMADLIHINRLTFVTEPALAKSWKATSDGLHWTLDLRRGIKFSDGQAFDADDVVFTFQTLLDEKVNSPQRDLLMLEGKPIGVRKVDRYTVVFDLPMRYSVPDRMFDGIYILPRHKLEAAWKRGRLGEAWPIGTPPAELAGLGPFRVKEYVAGQFITLERNPYYWKVDAAGVQLPYLAEVTFEFAGSEDSQAMRFEAGESDVIGRIGARDFAAFQKEGGRREFNVMDAGESMEYSLLVFNLAESPGRQKAWQRVKFRRAVSEAIDRDAIVRLVYLGRAVALAGPVPPGDKRWADSSLHSPVKSLSHARELLSADGFKWRRDGALLDQAGQPVEFSILTSNNNPERRQMAALIQQDLLQIGIRVNVVPMEQRSLIERIRHTHEFEACVISLSRADSDPNPDMAVWLSSGDRHLWNAGQKRPATAWEAEIDRAMRKQMVTTNYEERKKLFDRVQEILAENQPLVALVSPHLLVGAKKDLGNFHPAPLEPHTLWNIEQLYWRGKRPEAVVQ